MFTHYLIIIITTLCFCCAGHGPLTLIKWPMLSGSIIICLCMQEKYYLDPSSLKKNPVPPEDSILCKIMHNWQEFKIMPTDKSSFQQCPHTGRIHTRHPSSPASWKISSLGLSHAMTLKLRKTKTTTETIHILIDTKNLGREGGVLKI